MSKLVLDKCMYVCIIKSIDTQRTKGKAMKLLVNFYYSVRVLENGGYEDVGEDGLLALCRACAKQHATDVQWASRGDEQSECELCRASNDPAHSAELDAIYAQVVQQRRAYA